MSLTYSQIRTETLSEQIYDLLRVQVIKGNLKPGAPLVIEKIANELKVSTTPVRDALKLLTFNGYTTKKGANIYVIKLSAADVRELFDIREVLEGLAARLLAEQIERQPHKAASLEELAQRFRGEREKLLQEKQAIPHDLDVSLHDAVLQLCPSEKLELQVKTTMNQLYRMRELQYQSKLDEHLRSGKAERMLQETDEHIRIIEAILSADGDSAERAMREHIRNSKQDLFECVDVPEWKTRGAKIKEGRDAGAE